MSLSELLRQEAIRQEVLPDIREITPALAFVLVRDMPYERASSPDPRTVIQEWRATCSGKHYLLHALFDEMGLDGRIMMATHYFTSDYSEFFPPPLENILAGGPVPDVHTFLRLGGPNGPVDVDATYPLRARRLGLPANGAFRAGVTMPVACRPDEIVEVPENGDPEAVKEHLLQTHCGRQRERREEFIRALSRWISSTLHAGLNVL